MVYDLDDRLIIIFGLDKFILINELIGDEFSPYSSSNEYFRISTKNPEINEIINRIEEDEKALKLIENIRYLKTFLLK